MSKLADKLRTANVITQHKEGPVWAGPESDADNGGITQSLLGRWLSCKERTRLLLVEGLKPSDSWQHRISYGDMWHICEESFASSKGRGYKPGLRGDWEVRLQEYAKEACAKYPMDQEDIDKWYQCCKTQFPIYVDYWSKHQDVMERTPLLQEVAFRVPYALPSGRTVYLRGKWDSVDLIGKGKEGGVYLQENKTKGDVNDRQLRRQLTYDLQTMQYLIALDEVRKTPQEQLEPNLHKTRTYLKSFGLKGVRYNVIRRPLSGGKHTISRHKPTKKNPNGESKKEFFERLGGIIRDDPQHFFMRWKSEVSEEDITRFKQECFDPILEQLCCWWDWVAYGKEDKLPGWAMNYRAPFGVYNPLAEGKNPELDDYLIDGSTVGLTRTTNLFPELQDS